MRRYDLDWLRSLAFLLLILYHCGMMYVSWDWHITSQYQSESLKLLMLLVNQWRLPLLFFIAGAALYFALGRLSSPRLLTLRSVRLGVPLVLGILVIVPPQLFFEMRQAGEPTGGYLNFWLAYLTPNHPLFELHRTPLFGQMTWNHLWFLPYLWCYSVVLLLIAPGLKRLLPLLPEGLRFWFWVPWLLLATVYWLLRDDFPTTHALLDDWFNHGISLSVFVLGYVMAAKRRLWRTLRVHCFDFLVAAMFSYALLVAMYSLPGDTGMGAQVEYWGDKCVRALQALNLWLWILALCGLAHRFLSRDSALRRYSTEAVYPWYLLHQTITVCVGFYVSQWQWGPLWEPLAVVSATVIGCALGFELIRRHNGLRWLFGLAPRRAARNSPAAVSPVGHQLAPKTPAIAEVPAAQG